MGWHPLVDTETRRRPMLSLGARGATVGFLVVDPVKKRGSGGVLDLKVVTPFKVIPVKKVDVINATSSGPSVIFGCGGDVVMARQSSRSTRQRDKCSGQVKLDTGL